MLFVEKLMCENPQYHKECEWVKVPIRYPDTRYLLLKKRLTTEVLKTKVAYRILHNKFGVLCTLKFGHDGFLYVGDNQAALQFFATYSGH